MFAICFRIIFNNSACRGWPFALRLFFCLLQKELLEWQNSLISAAESVPTLSLFDFGNLLRSEKVKKIVPLCLVLHHVFLYWCPHILFFFTVAFKCYWQPCWGYFAVSLTFLPNTISAVILTVSDSLIQIPSRFHEKTLYKWCLYFLQKNVVSSQYSYGYCLFWPFVCVFFTFQACVGECLRVCAWSLIVCSSRNSPVVSLSYTACATKPDLLSFSTRDTGNDKVPFPPLFPEVVLI